MTALACGLALASILLAHYARGWRARAWRAWRARGARARERRRVLRDAAIMELEREVFAEYGVDGFHGWPELGRGAYRVVVKGGRRYHVYADHAVCVQRVDAV